MEIAAAMFALTIMAALGSVKTGMEAPEFSTDNLDGKQVTLSSYRGNKKVLVVFSRYIGCPWCQMFMIDLMNRAAEFKALNTEVLIVVNSEPEVVRGYEPPMDFPFVLIPDPTRRLYELYGVKTETRMGTWNVFKKSLLFVKYLPKYDWVKKGIEGNRYQPPACFLIDEKGTIVFKHIGADPADNPDASEIIELIRKTK